MHVLYVHQNFPAQFGHIAAYLTREKGWQCTFVSQTEPGTVAGMRKVRYEPRGGATAQTHYFARTFENAIGHAHGAYEALKPLREEIRPDLIVAHSGFGSTLFLPELFPDTPIVNHFEYYYRPHGSDLDFRPDWPPDERDVLRARARNAMILLDLEQATAGYSPTRFQQELLPSAYRSKVRVIHDGVDTAFWGERQVDDRVRTALRLPPDARVVTYVSRGLEAMRGFDIFMQVAKQVYENLDGVVFLVVGTERVAYGGDLHRIEEPSFKEHVLRRDAYDLERIRFLGAVPPDVLAQILSLSELHVYLTVPFVLSWSLLNAMACGRVILASDTAPVREVIRDGENGVLRDFFDVEGLAAAAIDVLKDPGAFRQLGAAARHTVNERYALDVVIPQMIEMYEDALGRGD
ncbi:MAG TPA: glycosyltransferase [Actinomycetota bacterium]|nr:glycosyltransferase [Actinomycetota bacterium]